MSKEIQLTRGKVTVVDDENFEELNKYKWSYSNKGHALRAGPCVNGKQTKIFMHRVILDTPDNQQTDYKDRDKLNNRRSNLRVATHAENKQNEGPRKNNKVGLKGVSQFQGKFRAQIRKDGAPAYLGIYDTAREAAIAYNAAAIVLHKEFAYLNEV